MSCPGELDLAIYVDGVQGPEGARRVESHLVGCRECRARVIGLRDEANLLTDVLMQRRREWRAVTPPAPTRHELAIGLPAAIGAATAAFAVLGVLLESRVPGGLDLLNPLRLMGAYEMAFDLIFLLRDRAPGLLELALSLGAVVSISGILTFVVGFVYRRTFGGLAVWALVLLCVAAPESAHAVRFAFDQDTHVPARETVAETMVLTGDQVGIDGRIEGDLIVAAERVSIRGTVEGSVYVFTRELEISGAVTGSVHAPAERIAVDGTVSGSMYLFTERFTLASGGRVGRDVGLVGEAGVIDGEIGRDVVFAGDWLELRGNVGRNVEVLWSERVSLLDGTRIAGSVNARLPGGSDVERAPDTEVGGGVQVSERQAMRERYLDHYRDPRFYLYHVLQLAGAFLFGLVIHRLFPWLLGDETPSGGRFFRLVGIGFAALVATPVAIVVAGLTVVGIPLAVAGLFAYVTALYTATVAVGAMVGQSLVPPRDPGTFGFGLSLLAGLAIVFVAIHVPFLGPAVFAVVLLLGLGVLFERGRALISSRRSPV